MRFWKVIFYVLTIFIASSSFGQVEFSSSIFPDTVAIGEHFQIDLVIDIKDTIGVDSIQWLPIEKDWSDKIEFLRIDTGRYSASYVFTTFDTSFVAVPPISFVYGLDTLRSKAELLLVTYPTVDLTAKARDVKPIMKVEFSSWEKIKTSKWIIPTLLLIIAVSFLIWYFLRRKRKSDLPDENRDSLKLTASDIAYQRLNALQNKDLFAKGLIKEHYVELSSIFRNYIEDRFEIAALEETTDQLISSLKSSEVHRGDVSKLKRILELSDMVKFAKAKPAVFDHERSMKDSRNFIMNTKIGSIHEE